VDWEGTMVLPLALVDCFTTECQIVRCSRKLVAIVKKCHLITNFTPLLAFSCRVVWLVALLEKKGALHNDFCWKKQKPQGNLLRGETFRGKRASQLCLSATNGRIRRYFSQVGKSAVFPV